MAKCLKIDLFPTVLTKDYLSVILARKPYSNTSGVNLFWDSNELQFLREILQLVPLKFWSCNAHAIHGKLENLEHDERNVDTPVFGNLAQAFARQRKPSIQRVRTGGNTRDADSSKRLKHPRIKIGEISTFLTLVCKLPFKFFIFGQEYIKFEADCLTIWGC